MARRSRFLARFWGVRGSIPTPGPRTRLTGGNTSCLEVRVGEQVVVLDAGSGIRGLGEQLASENVGKATIFFSHVHWDHILGFPYFRPAAERSNELVLFGERKRGAGLDEILDFQAGRSHQPIVEPGRGARAPFEEIEPGDQIAIGPATVTVARMNHPDGCVAFRIEHEGRVLVYATDTEHPGSKVDEDLVRLAQGADALIYDAMYTREEYSGQIGGSKKGWGHSTWNDGVAVAKAAGVERLLLFHHDPSHDDRVIARIEKEARSEFPGALAAREGMVLDLAGDRIRPARPVKAPEPLRAARRACT